MDKEKLKEQIAMFGGFLGALLLFLKSIGVNFTWFNEVFIFNLTNLMTSAIPLIMIGYGIYKNTYLITEKAKEQKSLLKEKGLK